MSQDPLIVGISSEEQPPLLSSQHEDQERPLLTDTSKKTGWWRKFQIIIAVAAWIVVTPLALATPNFLGWQVAFTALTLFVTATYFRLLQMMKMRKNVPRQELDQRRDCETGEDSYAEAGGWATVPQDIIAGVSFDVFYMLVGGQCLMKLYELSHCPYVTLGDDCVEKECNNLSLQIWICIFAAPQFIFALLPNLNLNSIFGILLAAASISMTFSYSSVAGADSFKTTRILAGNNDLDYRFKYPLSCLSPSLSPGQSPSESSHKYYQVLSVVYVFGMAVMPHNHRGLTAALGLETEDSRCSRGFRKPDAKTVKVDWHNLNADNLIFMLGGVQVYTYIMYSTIHEGSAIRKLFMWFQSHTSIIAASFLILTHIIGTYQSFAVPVYEMLDRAVEGRLSLVPKSCFARHLINRWSYIYLTGFVACALPFFSIYFVYLEILFFAPVTYFLPFIIRLAFSKPEPNNLNWIMNWVLIIVGALVYTYIFRVVSSTPETFK